MLEVFKNIHFLNRNSVKFELVEIEIFIFRGFRSFLVTKTNSQALIHFAMGSAGLSSLVLWLIGFIGTLPSKIWYSDMWFSFKSR